MGKETDKELLYPELSYDIVGCAQRVHTTLGPGFPEAVYEKALCIELSRKGIAFLCQKRGEVAYEGMICGEFRMDIVVNEQIVLELKAMEAINHLHMAQALSYLKATGLKLAIIINFGEERLKTQRVVL
ncbi:MAG: GxxExxY protein [Planctomycetaceae bacterium]|nr:GxxExxY protein [Planctomycetaceae bacterium]